MGRGDRRGGGLYILFCCNDIAGCFVYLYFIYCIMITAGVGQLLDRDTALLFLEANLECPFANCDG